jgi:hypothetical protein
MTTRRTFLHLSLGALAATSTAVTLPHVAQGQGRTFKLKTRDGVGLFMKDTGGSGRTEGIAQARLIEYPDASHGIVLTERDRVTRDLQAFIAS